MAAYKLLVAYDGTDFAGWQRQLNRRTVQALIEDALAPIEGRPVRAVAAGRTDAGVHAAGQVVSVALDAGLAPERLARALNAVLPEDVRIMACEAAPPGFDARKHAVAKTYRYTIFNGPVMPPALRRTAWHVPQPLALGPMQEAAAAIVGTHDFRPFQARGSAVKTTVRTVTKSVLGRVG
ncbi:MAG: tRNA pseudouridine synthase A, partial [Acidobacteriota bacterium]